jgi:hypothetical protein
MRRHALPALALVAVAACGKTGGTVGEWFGASDKPQKPPVFSEQLCDPSTGSTCSAETLRETTESVLREVVDRPGSIVRLWMQGRSIEGTRPVATATVPVFRVTGRRARAEAENRWVAEERDAFCRAAEPGLRKRIRRSPIAESLGVIALASPSTRGKRQIVAITDGLEVSDYGEFECGHLPKPDRFARLLATHRVLPHGSLAGVDVRFCHVDLGAIDGGRCAVSLARAAEVRAIWHAALAAAGATHINIRPGALESQTTTTAKESGNVQTIQ